jgi:glucose/mannose transport system permease protein
MIKSRRDTAFALLLLSPTIVFLSVFIYGFIGWTTRVSVSNWQGIIPDYSFVGLRNYSRIFRSIRFQTDLWNTFYFTLFLLLGCIALALLLAFTLDRKVKGENFFRTVFIFPIALSMVVTGVAWRWILNPEFGINTLIRLIGFRNFDFGWYTDPIRFLKFNVPLVSLLIAALWQLTGYIIAMFLAAMRGIPNELRDAWTIDGASEWRAFVLIVVPIIKPVILSGAILLVHMSLKLFTLVYNMTGPGPAFATDVPALNMYETTFAANRYGEGAAISIVMLILTAMIIIPYLFTTRKDNS